MNRVAKGSFKVDMTPQADSDSHDGVTIARLLLDKRYEGDLAAVGAGQMLTARTPIDGSAGYVAIERVTGELHGRRGSFVLQHSGTMDRRAQQLAITVVADSGTGELAGMSGTLRVKIVGAEHFYEFEYTLQRPAK